MDIFCLNYIVILTNISSDILKKYYYNTIIITIRGDYIMDVQKRKVAQTTKITIFGFMLLILLGGVLLNLPISNTTDTTFLDSLFTSAASVCVAGLSTVTAAEQYTVFGKVVMLGLIQVGALGFIVIMSAFYMLIKRKITYKEQVMISESVGSEGNLENLRKLIILLDAQNLQRL